MEIDIKDLLEKLKELEYWLDGVMYNHSSKSNVSFEHVNVLDDAINTIETYHQRLYGDINNGST